MSLGPPLRDPPPPPPKEEWKPHPTRPGIEVNTLTGMWRTALHGYLHSPVPPPP